MHFSLDLVRETGSTSFLTVVLIKEHTATREVEFDDRLWCWLYCQKVLLESLYFTVHTVLCT